MPTWTPTLTIVVGGATKKSDIDAAFNNTLALADGTKSHAKVGVDDAAPATPAAGTLYRDTLVNAWAAVTYSGGVPSLVRGVNIASLTDNGTGDCTVTFAQPMDDADYAAVANPREFNVRKHCACESVSAGSLRVLGYDDAAMAVVDSNFSLIVVGGHQ